MCGIAGIWRNTHADELRSSIQAMTDTLIHRGPDGEGHWVKPDSGLAFGHRRLSIIDLSQNGKQPMHYLDRYVITYNGEIYNYLELKVELEAKGASFRTDSDTEVLLAAYHFWGHACLEQLDGMFAFAIYDQEEQTIFCVRDRFGEKPFYYFKDQEQFVFASEMKAIFAIDIPKKVSHSMLYRYLVFDVIENPYDKAETFYEEIYQLPPAHCLLVDLNSNSFKIWQYWDINPNHQIEISVQEAVARFQELFYESVKTRMRSDVKVGSSLSGGVDSSSVLASIKTLFPNAELNTFTARFNDKNYDEGHFVEILRKAHTFNTNFCFPKSSQIIDELDQIFHHQEEPFGSTSIIAQWEVMKLAKEKGVTVLLDGQGADETLAGYFTYFMPFLDELYRTDRPSFKRELAAIESFFDQSPYLPKSFYLRANFPILYVSLANMTRPFRMGNIAPDLSKDFIGQFKRQASPFKPIFKLNPFLYSDTFKYGLGKLLRFSDRNAMAHSREVRLPYLSHRLVEFAFSLPNQLKINSSWTKYILRKSMEDIVPKEIVYRKDKKGFQAPSSWLKQKATQELIDDSVQLLMREGILQQPDASKSWQYIMAAKTINHA